MIKKIITPFLFLTILSFGIISCEAEEEPIEESDIRDQFIGAWVCTETSSINGERTYNVNIDYDTTSSADIELINFYQIGMSEFVLGTVSTTNIDAISIPVQTVDGKVFEGTGSTQGNNTLNFIYVVDDGLELDSIAAVFIKQ